MKVMAGMDVGKASLDGSVSAGPVPRFANTPAGSRNRTSPRAPTRGGNPVLKDVGLPYIMESSPETIPPRRRTDHEIDPRRLRIRR